MPDIPRFHLAVPVTDLDATVRFYVDGLGAGLGRTASRWVDLDVFGHQITLHLVDTGPEGSPPTNPVDGEHVPVPHFGVILDIPAWRILRDRLQDRGERFLIAPQVRFEGEPGEQHTLFVSDPSGNVVELKAFADDASVFRSA